jgi:hypothetical protein
MFSDDQFRETVKSYVSLHDQLAETSKALRDLRKKKVELSDAITKHMKELEIGECVLNDGKLILRQSKKTEALKKEHIIRELQTILGGDSEKAEASVNNILNKRNVQVSEALRRTRNKDAPSSVHV